MDKYFFNRYNDSDLVRYNYTKVEVPEDCFDDFTLNDFNDDLTFSVEKYNARKQKVELQKELNTLLTWFDEYDNQIKQYQRCVRLNIEYDKDINELDNQAKVNQARIREIRLELL